MSSSIMSSRTRTADSRSTITDSFFGARSNSVASSKRTPKTRTWDKLDMPNPMTFPVPNVDKPLPEVGWGEDPHSSAGKRETKRDNSAAKPTQSSKKPSRNKHQQRVQDTDRATSLGKTPPGTLAKLLVAEESNTRKTRKLLDAALHQLQYATQRPAQAESQKRRVDNDTLLESTQLSLDVEEAKKAATKAQNEAEMYKLRLQQVEAEALQAKQTIQAVEEMREDAERSAAKARATARKFKQEMAKMMARAEGRKEGYVEGLQRGRLIVGTSYEYIPGDGTAYIEEVGTEAEEEYTKQQKRHQDRSRDVSVSQTPYGTEAPLSRRAESRTSNPTRRSHTRQERDRDRHRERENDRRGGQRRYQESDPGHRQERREYKDRQRDHKSYPSPPETPRAAFSQYERRPIQDPPQDLPEGVSIPMSEPRAMPPPVPEIPHIPTPPRTVVSSHNSNHPASPPQSSVHTSQAPHTVIINFASPNAGAPSTPSVTVTTVPPAAEPASVPTPAFPPPKGHTDSQSIASGSYPDAPLPDGISPVPRISIPLGPGFYSDQAANAPLSAGGVPFAPGLYRDANGALEQAQPIVQPSPIPPGGVTRSSPEIETPSTMTGSSFNFLRNFPNVPAGVAGSDGARSASRPSSRPGGVFGFERKLSTINESREGTPSGGGLGPSLARIEEKSNDVDQWRRSLSDSPNHLRPPSRSASGSQLGGDLRRKQSSTTTGSGSIQIQIESPSPAPSDHHSSDSGYTAQDVRHRRYYDDRQPQEPGYLSPHHTPRNLISPEPDPNEAPVIPGHRNVPVPKSALKNTPRIYEDLPRGFVANGHASSNGYADFSKLDALGNSAGLGINQVYSRENVRRRSYEDSSEDSEDDEDEYSDDDDDDDEQWPPAPPGAVTGGMPLGVPFAPGLGPNYHPISGTGLNLMSFPIVAGNGSTGRGSGDSASGSVMGTPRMYGNTIPTPMHGLPPGFSRAATSTSGKSSRSSRSLKAPGFEIYANPSQNQSMVKPAGMSMPSTTVPQYGSAQPMQGGSAITPAAYQIPEPGVLQYSQSGPVMPGSSITSAALAMPEASVPRYPSASNSQQVSAITPAAMSMPDASVPDFSQSRSSSAITPAQSMPEPTVPRYPTTRQGSAITAPSMSMPEPGINQTGAVMSGSSITPVAMARPDANVPQYPPAATHGQGSTITPARMQMPDAGVPLGPSLPLGPGSSRITEPAMSMPAPSSNMTASQMSMPTPASRRGSVTVPTPTVTDYTRGTPSTRPSTMTPAAVTMPSPSVPQYPQASGGASTITPAAVTMPSPSVPQYPQTPGGTSSITPAAVSMPLPSVPQYSQTPGGTSTMTPAAVNMPSPSVPQYPQTPGGSTITPAAMPMPEPSSNIITPSMTMPTPTSTITGARMTMPSPGVEYTPGGSLAQNPLPAPPRMTPSMTATLNINPPSPVIPGAWGGGYAGSAGDTGTPHLSRRTSLHAGTTPSMGVQPLPTATMSKKKKKKEKKKVGSKMPVPTVNGTRVGPADSDEDEGFDEATMLNTLANANNNQFSAMPTPIYR